MHINIIDAHYFAREDRPPHSFIGITNHVANSSEYLRKRALLWYTAGVPQSKGGQSVTDGRFSDSKGGSKEASVHRGDCEAHVTEGDVTGPQDRQGMAYLSERAYAASCGGTSPQKSEQTSRLEVLSVAELAPILSQGLSASSCLRYLLVILPYGNGNDKG
jgi:hypothetical protein